MLYEFRFCRNSSLPIPNWQIHISQLGIGCQEVCILQYKDAFAQRLAALRRERNLTLRQMEEAIGITNQALSLLEKGRNAPTFDVLCRLADYFGVSLDYLVGRTDEPRIAGRKKD